MSEPINTLANNVDAASTRFEKNMLSMAELVPAISNEEEPLKQLASKIDTASARVE
jgi:hypothetical protein